MRTVKWCEGVKNMVSKRDARKDVNTFMRNGRFEARKSNFTLLAKRAGIGGWREAIDAVVNKNDTEIAKTNLAVGDPFILTKSELRRAADLL